ncbi:MAG: hypothetical protein JO131_04800 [Gammaproteobacteria bacterium]|nr:hypothetical protein [Gammaproteobacteria bacterium]
MQSFQDKKENNLDKAVTLALKATQNYLETETSLFKKMFGEKGKARAKKIKKVLTHPQLEQDELAKIVALQAIFSNKNSSKELLSFIANQWISGEYITYSCNPSQNVSTLHSDIFASTLLNEKKLSYMKPNPGMNLSLRFDKKKAISFLLEKTFSKKYENKNSLVNLYTNKLHEYFEHSKEETLASLFFLSDPNYTIARTAGVVTGLFHNLPSEVSTHISFFLTDKETRCFRRICKRIDSIAKETEEQAINGTLHFSKK